MCDKKIGIRAADKSDCEDVYFWRGDVVSRTMSFNSDIPSYDDHLRWFNYSLNNTYRKLYIGEIGSSKIGVCRFDHKTKTGVVEVSINMNPKFRGRGLSKQLLDSSIRFFQNTGRNDFLARIKPNNVASLKLFQSLGFQEISSKEDMVKLVKCDKKIRFKEVSENDTDILFSLLKQRIHSISHMRMPTKNEHKAFVQTNPYRYWAIIIENNNPAGAFYIQNDNSVGLNIVEPSLYLVSQVLAYIQGEFEPRKEIKSKVPTCFYVNVAFGDDKLREILLEVGADPIQISYKI